MIDCDKLKLDTKVFYLNRQKDVDSKIHCYSIEEGVISEIITKSVSHAFIGDYSCTYYKLLLDDASYHGSELFLSPSECADKMISMFKTLKKLDERK